ncbi:MAG: sensor histidine kinase [Flavobacteriales bacterium]|nr:sensor histidine kinase [Flavobacteriales bacterium]
MYQKAVILDANNYNEKALDILLNILEDQYELSDSIRISSLITSSLLYEKLSMFDKSLEMLDASKAEIEKTKFYSLNPFYYLRKSSLYRVQNDTVLAEKALQNAIYWGKIYKDYNNLGQCYMVKSFLEFKKNPFKSKSSIMMSLENIKHSKDKRGLTVMLAHLSNWHKKYGKIDSAYYYINSAIDTFFFYGGTDEFTFLFLARSRILEAQKKAELALKDYKQYYEYTINNIKRRNKVEIVQITEQYENDKIKLALSNKEKALEVNKRYNVLAFISSTIFFLLALTAFLLLKRGNRLYKVKNEINRKLKKAIKREKILLKELHHRVKNNLQLIVGLMELQYEENSEIKSIKNQIFSISAGHDLIYQSSSEEMVNVYEYMSHLVKYMISSYHFQLSPKIDIEIEESFELSLDKMVTIGLLYNELITNSIKHAQIPNKTLIMTLKMQYEENNQLVMSYIDNGPGLNKKSRGFGSVVINSTLEQLEANIQIISSNNGLSLTISAPLNKSGSKN